MNLADRLSSLDLSDTTALGSLLEEVGEFPLLKCAVLLRLGQLDAAHSLAQDDDSDEGSYWHGIMHRAEGDYSNSKYWFARSGSLPARLGVDASGLTDRVRAGEDVHNELDREWHALAVHCAQTQGVLK